MRFHRTIAMILVGLFWNCLWSVSGCHRIADSQKKSEYEGREIQKIVFKGNKALTDKQLLSFLPIQKGDHFVIKNESAVFDIILQAYAAYGYYDTRIAKIEAIPLRRNRVFIRIHLLEGDPVQISSVRFHWQQAYSSSAELELRIPLKAGDAASVDALNRSVEILRNELLSNGYALAFVDESMTIHKSEHRAEVQFDIQPGVVCRIGEIRVQGLVHISEYLIYRELEEYEGKIFTPNLEAEMEDAVDGLNVFRVVSIEAVPDESEPTRVDVNVSVIEADFQHLKLGVGVQFETNKFLTWTSATYQHNNFLHRLNQFRLRALAGWALVPAFWNIEEMGPVSLIEPSFTKKGLLERKLYWTIAFALQTDVEENYKLFSPSFRPSISRTFFKRLTIRLGYNLEYIMIYGLRDLILQEVQRQYEDMRSPIRLANLNFSTRLMLTDNLSEPNNGVVLRFDYWHSGKYLGSEVSYNKIQPSISAYWRPISFFQIALRSEIGVLSPLAGPNFTGIRSNFFLGGYNTVRGWGGKRLAPWVKICVDAAEQECEKIWLGGKTMLLGNAELRFTLSRVVDVVTFFDAGDVQYEVYTIAPGEWNYSVGGGIRIKTPLGKFRFDMGYRLNEPELYRSEPRFGVHLGLGEAF